MKEIWRRTLRETDVLKDYAAVTTLQEWSKRKEHLVSEWNVTEELDTAQLVFEPGDCFICGEQYCENAGEGKAAMQKLNDHIEFEHGKTFEIDEADYREVAREAEQIGEIMDQNEEQTIMLEKTRATLAYPCRDT